MPIVYLAISQTGLHHAIEAAKPMGASVWCGSDAITESEFLALDQVDVTRFNYPLNGESLEVLEDALSTIEEHHPGATIWVETIQGTMSDRGS